MINEAFKFMKQAKFDVVKCRNILAVTCNKYDYTVRHDRVGHYVITVFMKRTEERVGTFTTLDPTAYIRGLEGMDWVSTTH